MFRRRHNCLSLLLNPCVCFSLTAQPHAATQLDDMTRFRNVSDPQISPDGKWVAYVVNTTNAKDDKSNSHIWMVGIDGSNDRQITFSNESENSPRWSPDGKYLSFTSSRPGGKTRGNQVWLLDRNGGEAMQLTEIKGRLQGHEWSPDSKRLALVIGIPTRRRHLNPSPHPAPHRASQSQSSSIATVSNQDGAGYLLRGRNTYIYLSTRDKETREITQEQMG